MSYETRPVSEAIVAAVRDVNERLEMLESRPRA